VKQLAIIIIDYLYFTNNGSTKDHKKHNKYLTNLTSNKNQYTV